MSKQIWVLRGGKVLGPFSPGEIRQMSQRRQVEEGDRFSTEGKSWMSLEQVLLEVEHGVPEALEMPQGGRSGGAIGTGKMICRSCGSQLWWERESLFWVVFNGFAALGVNALWLLLAWVGPFSLSTVVIAIVAVSYALWCVLDLIKRQRGPVCRKCGSRELLSLDSPRGRLEKQRWELLEGGSGSSK